MITLCKLIEYTEHNFYQKDNIVTSLVECVNVMTSNCKKNVFHKSIKAKNKPNIAIIFIKVVMFIISI